MSINELPAAFHEGIAKLETRGFRVVRIAPNGPDPGLGYTAYLCKRLRTGLRLAQVEMDVDGNITTHR